MRMKYIHIYDVLQKTFKDEREGILLRFDPSKNTGNFLCPCSRIVPSLVVEKEEKSFSCCLAFVVMVAI